MQIQQLRQSLESLEQAASGSPQTLALLQLLRQSAAQLTTVTPAASVAPAPTPANTGDPFGLKSLGSPAAKPTPVPKVTEPRQLLPIAVDLIQAAIDCTAASEANSLKDLDHFAETLTPMLLTEVGRMNKAVEKATASLQRLRTLASEGARLQQETSSLSSDNAELLSRIQIQRSELDEVRARNTALVAEAETLDQELSKLRAKVSNITAAQQEKKQLEQQIQAGQQAVDDLSKCRGELQERAASLGEQQATLRRLVESLEFQAGSDTVEKIRSIWQQLPPDAFDEVAHEYAGNR